MVACALFGVGFAALLQFQISLIAMSAAESHCHPRIDGDDYVPALLATLSNRLSSGASQLYLDRYGVGINEWRILSVLSNTPGSNATHIGETVSMHKTVVSRSVRSMEDKGLLLIHAEGTARTMSLTPEGQRLHNEIADIALAREALLLSVLDASEIQTLQILLQRLRANLPELDRCGAITLAQVPDLVSSASQRVQEPAEHTGPRRRGRPHSRSPVG